MWLNKKEATLDFWAGGSECITDLLRKGKGCPTRHKCMGQRGAAREPGFFWLLTRKGSEKEVAWTVARGFKFVDTKGRGICCPTSEVLNHHNPSHGNSTGWVACSSLTGES